MENEKMLKFCPSCGSINVKSSIIQTITIAPIYRCINCDFQGAVLEGTAEFIAKFRKGLGKDE